jgi:hypothetical protein
VYNNNKQWAAVNRGEKLMAKTELAKLEPTTDIWSLEQIPYTIGGRPALSSVSGRSLKVLLQELEKGEKGLPQICEEIGVKTREVLRLSDQVKQIEEALALADRIRARNLEVRASDAYSGTIEESLKHTEITRYTKEGDEYTEYSSAAVSMLKARSQHLLKQAAISDPNRYGDKQSEGLTVNVGINNNTVNNMPTTLEEVQGMSIAELTDITSTADM